MEKTPTQSEKTPTQSSRVYIVIGVVAAAALGVLLFWMPGCGGRVYAEVEGTVTLDGQPLADVAVGFYPADGPQGPRAAVITNKDGRYKLRPEQEFLGVVVGWNKVVVVPNLDEKLKDKMPPVPKKYFNTFSTPLQFYVRRGEQTIDIALSTTP
jgi:hypothetical protein